MTTFEQVGEMLDGIASLFPQEIYTQLNGGIVLSDDVKLNPAGKDDDLYILGEYHKSGHLGRFIVIYYGSFMRVFGHCSKEALYKQLERVLKHEFTHHLESLAGEHHLEKKDHQHLAKYLNSKEKPD